jgi:hypothetical protein
VHISALHGRLPRFRDGLHADDDGGGSARAAAAAAIAVPATRPSAVYVAASLVAGGEVLGLETRSAYAEAGPAGAAWSEWVTFCVKVYVFVGACVFLLVCSSVANGLGLMGQPISPQVHEPTIPLERHNTSTHNEQKHTRRTKPTNQSTTN